eukprot:scaffold348489_cov28-Prasinocladus_malaysianus.AAC.5
MSTRFPLVVISHHQSSPPPYALVGLSHRTRACILQRPVRLVTGGVYEYGGACQQSALPYDLLL